MSAITDIPAPPGAPFSDDPAADEQIREAEQVKRLQQDATFQMVIERLESTYFLHFRQQVDPVALASLHAKCQALADIKKAMALIVSQGESAQARRGRFVGKR